MERWLTNQPGCLYILPTRIVLSTKSRTIGIQPARSGRNGNAMATVTIPRNVDLGVSTIRPSVFIADHNISMCLNLGLQPTATSIEQTQADDLHKPSKQYIYPHCKYNKARSRRRGERRSSPDASPSPGIRLLCRALDARRLCHRRRLLGGIEDGKRRRCRECQRARFGDSQRRWFGSLVLGDMSLGMRRRWRGDGAWFRWVLQDSDGNIIESFLMRRALVLCLEVWMGIPLSAFGSILRFLSWVERKGGNCRCYVGYSPASS